MLNWNEKALAALKGNEKNEIKLIKSFCVKNGFEFRKGLLAYRDFQRRLVDYEKQVEIDSYFTKTS